MAAYAALASLMNLIDQIRHHPQPPITLDGDQTQSLTEKIASLQNFLEAYNRHYSNQEVERLRICIANAAYAAEDVIESHIVDQILARTDQTSCADLYQSQRRVEENIIVESTSTHDADKICSAYLYQGLQKVLEEMDFIKKEVEEIREKLGAQEHLQRIMPTPVISPKSHSTQHNIMVGFDDVLYELLHKLTGQPDSPLQIIPISGMAGIGKTTLARNVYESQLIVDRFYICSWVTISQQYNTREIVLELLCGKKQENMESLSEMSEAELGEKLSKSLFGRSYLIVMDDMWSNDVWDKIKFCFPNNNKGSRIIVTTRLSKVASYLNNDCGYKLNFLDQEKSWSLFCKTVFGEEDCPPELKDMGMEIAQNCKGLPLAIVVLGGLLAKSKPTREYWAYILQNVSSIVNLEEILRTSYDELPVHLKACFLYLGTFRKDSKIRVSSLISMWVAEGFFSPISGKSLEQSGEEYLMDLIDRNLVLVSESGYFEKVVVCTIHDLLRDLCIREAQKERFFFFSANLHDHEGLNTPRRIVIDGNKMSKPEDLLTLQSASAARSLICNSVEGLSFIELRMLRVLKRIGERKNWSEDSFQQINLRYQQINLRYVAVDYHNIYPMFSSSVSHLWNLQTIISRWGSNVVAPPEIWKMPLLRHVECSSLTLPDPPSGDTEEFVLHNLHTLSGIVNLKFGEEVVNRIPNVKKLTLHYEEESDYFLNNLGHLWKLEYLDCTFPIQGGLLQNLIFPHSLKELSLCNIRLRWEDMDTKIGSLPHLQMLKLYLFYTTSDWETIQEQFCSLRYLSIGWCTDWENWTADSPGLPRLEHLSLDNLLNLQEIPWDIGNIPTLESIQLRDCSYSAIISAKHIAEEQEEFGNESLRVTVLLSKHLIRGRKEYLSLKSLASHNFQVEFV